MNFKNMAGLLRLFVVETFNKFINLFWLFVHCVDL